MEDRIYKFLELYNNSPQFIKSTVGKIYNHIPIKFRYGANYEKYIKLLEKSKNWNKKNIEEFQWNQIKIIINHSYKNVPYYTNLFNELNIKPQNLQNMDDFKNIPFLTKDIIREQLNNLIAKNSPRSKFMYVTTGGSTGLPLGLYYQKGETRTKEFVFNSELWGMAGYKMGDKVAVLRGNKVKSIKENKFWEYEPIKNRLILSSYHMIENTLPLYIEILEKFKPKFLHVYPSSLSVLAEHMSENNIKNALNIKTIFTSSETIYEWQIKLFKEIFNCQILDLYALTENVAFAGNCQWGNDYHVYPEFSFVELIDKNDNRVTDENIVGEIVGTTFDNFVMPLIRYRTMDYAILSKNNCNCGKNYMSLKHILGRKQEFFIDKTGVLITFTISDKPLRLVKEKINAYQYIQTKAGKVSLNIDSKIKFTKSEIEKVKNAFKEFYPRFQIKIKFVENIPRTKSGKFQYLVQNLPIKFENYIKFDTEFLNDRY